MMDQLVKSPDFTWAMSKVFIWSCCEPFVGIVCACLPTYAPLVRSLWRRGGSSYAGMPDNYASDRSKSANMKLKVGGEGGVGGSVTGNSGSSRVRSLHHHSRKDSAYRGDDEIELTVDISGQKLAPPSSRSSSKTKIDETAGYQLEANEIMVRKDFSWSSSS